MKAPLAHRQLDALYARLPKIECQGKCWPTCGPVVAVPAEERRIVTKTGQDIHAALAGYVRVLEDTGQRVQAVGGASTCVFLKERRCSIYAIRPLLCRLYGLVEAMPCAFGCTPERQLTREEEQGLWATIGQIRPAPKA